jgi:NADPH2:quinone reductase
MRAIGYQRPGGVDVLHEFDQPVREPAPGEVRVRVVISGVNPTDWKKRRGTPQAPIPPGQYLVPHQDGAGIVDAVGPDVEDSLVGKQVWLWEAANGRLDGGTAQEFAMVPAVNAVPLPAGADFELGACLGVPFVTAHRALTLHEQRPPRLSPRALDATTVLVTGGAGAVGNATIQLARWAGASVIATVSSPEKARLAAAAGADHVLDYRRADIVDAVRALRPAGVDIVVDVAVAANATTDAAVLANGGVIAAYSNTGGPELTAVAIQPQMRVNARWQFVLLYTMPTAAKMAAVGAINAAVEGQAIAVGEHAGLPLHHFPLEEVAAAQLAVENGAVGKVLVHV